MEHEGGAVNVMQPEFTSTGGINVYLWAGSQEGIQATLMNSSLDRHSLSSFCALFRPAQAGQAHESAASIAYLCPSV
eukprot:777546-Pelagomonas_calceolata.AAC.1